MADATLAFLDSSDLGRVEQRVGLRGKLACPSGARASATLVRTTRGVFVVAAKVANDAVAIPLVGRSDVRYELGRFGDQLRIGEAELSVPASSRREARLALGLGRLGVGDSLPRLPEARHVRAPGPLERAFVAGFLREGELLFAFQKTDDGAPIESPWCPGLPGTGYLVVTSERKARVVLSELGDSRVESLDGVSFSIDEGLGASDVLAGRFRFEIRRGDLELWQEIVAGLCLEGAARLRSFALANWRGRQDAAAAGFARELFATGKARGDALAAAAVQFLALDGHDAGSDSPDVDALVAGLAEAGAPADALGSLWQSLGATPEAATFLVDRLRALGDRAEPWALGLHECLHARLTELRKDPRRLARADIDFAEHLIASAQRERARVLLEARVKALPSEELLDLLPSDDADLTAGAGGQIQRIRVYELLAEARRTADGPCLRARTELARLQPLVIDRVRVLSKDAPESLRQRAELVLDVLAPRGLRRDEDDAGTEPAALSAELLGEVLSHPAARKDSALVGRIQTLLATVPAPDHGMLLEYVEPISLARQPKAARALAGAARLLGHDPVQGFVSRGKKGIGLRAYEGPPAFVLVGGRHLDDDPEYGMTSAELRFAITTEVAHVAFGHARVTSSEVWLGLVDKSREGLDLLLGVLPLFKSYRVAERAYRLLQKVPVSTIRRVVGGARAVQKKLAKGPAVHDERVGEDVLSALHEDLVATARVMQLTADRAGLVACGDPRAALRAMLLVRPDHREALALAEREGIEMVLRQRAPEGHLAHQDLAVRIAALLSFYLSDDYARLAREAGLAQSST